MHNYRYHNAKVHYLYLFHSCYMSSDFQGELNNLTSNYEYKLWTRIRLNVQTTSIRLLA
jgi:hypothetical protein